LKQAAAPSADGLPRIVLFPVFLLSGFAALLYQLVWQRSLFRIYGTTMESVTLVVTAFMLGLGIGSVAGGVVSEKTRWPLPIVFGLVELVIGAFGLISLPLFGWIATFTSGATGLAVGLISFVAVVIPTLFMGGTLPILVAHQVRQSGNVGRSVGGLYFVNTLGSAAASFAAALWILGELGLSRSVAVAATLNLIVAASVMMTHVLRKGRA
jgi:predicted membrane-bound spermidine synthase